MGLLLHDFPDFWQHLYHLVLLLHVTGTFVTDMVLLRRGGSFAAKLEKGITKTIT